MNEQEINPGKLLDISGRYWATCTLHAGVKLNVFTVIGEKSLNSEAVSKEINAATSAIHPGGAACF